LIVTLGKGEFFDEMPSRRPSRSATAIAAAPNTRVMRIIMPARVSGQSAAGSR